MAPVGRPENVLKRADELVAMDKQSAALDLLYETLTSKRTRNTSLSFLEPVVLRFVELCVELRKGKVVRDGLHQYKKLVVPGNVESLALVVEKLFTLSEAKVTSAQAQADQIIIEEDLESQQSPEDLLMSTVSSEQTKDRTDREVVTPWLKFLWEAYRSVLDVLRNNLKLEETYTKIVGQALKFCLRYKRKMEFRRLCELLRNHLQMASQAQKQPGQNPVDLKDPNTLQLYLDSRFEQLNVAVKLELWQEAFWSVEDVHMLLTASRRPIKPSNLGAYYETLARIFLVSNNQLFHAAAWGKYYTMIHNTRHSAPQGELERIASFYLLSVLCIPNSANVTSALSTRYNRLSSLLNLASIPTKDSLLGTALSKNVLEYVRPEIKDLYLLLEENFHPLTIKESVVPIFEALAKFKVSAEYFEPLLHVVTSRVFFQLSQAYTTLKLDFVADLVSFPSPFDLPQRQVEKLLVQGSQSGQYRVRLDHKAGTATFINTLALETDGGDLEPSATGAARQKLKVVASVIDLVVPQARIALKAAKVPAPQVGHARADIKSLAASGLHRDYDKFRERRQRLRERQEQMQLAARAKEEREQKERAARVAAAKAAEKERLETEHKRRTAQEEQLLRKKVDRDTKKAIADQINASGLAEISLEDLDKYSVDDLQNLQIENLGKRSTSLKSTMVLVARRYDHIERALRLEESKLWQADALEQAKRDTQAYNERKERICAVARNNNRALLAYHERFSRMSAHFEGFTKDLFGRRHEAYLARKQERASELQEAKKSYAEKVHAERERAAEKAAKAAEEKAAKEKADALRAAALKSPTESREATPIAKPAASPFGAAKPVSTKPASPFGAAKPAASPFGAAKPVSTKPAASPFGAAKPVSTKPAASPFGAAKPVSTKPAASPFGAAKPVSTKPAASPFGAAKPAASPFGAAKPVSTKPAASPFGAAKPTTAPGSTARDPVQARPKTSLFGNAKPVQSPGPGPAPVASPEQARRKLDPFGRAKPVRQSESPKTEEKFVPSYKK